MSKNNSTNTTVNEAQKVQQLVEERASILLNQVLSENVKKYMLESITEEDDDDDVSTSVETDNSTDSEGDKDVDNSVDTDDTTEDDDITTIDDETDGGDEVGDLTSIVDEPSNEPIDDSSDESAWDEFEQFKDGGEDGVYDFTGVEDSEIVTKVYKLLNDDDNVVIVKNDDDVQISDNETGAEYIVKLGDTNTSIESDEMTMTEGVEDIVGFDDEQSNEDVIDLNELGNIEGLSVSEGESDGDVIEEEETVEEITTVTGNNARKAVKTHTSTSRKDNLPLGSQNVSAGGQYVGDINEAIVNKALVIKEENYKLKTKLNEIYKVMKESLISNSNLSHIIKLFMENSTTKPEKEDILKRFGKDVNTVKEGNALYESITRELSQKSKTTLTEKRVKTEKSLVSESVVKRSPETLKALDLMNRLK